MTGRIKWYRRRSFYGVLAVALVALAVPISYAFAGTGSKVTVPVQRYDGSCNYYAKDKVIGSATIEHTKSNSVIVTYTVTGAIPSNGYYLYLYSDTPTPCTDIGYGGKIKIDSSGHGSKTFEVTGLGGYNDFWVYAANGEADRTPVVHF